VGGPPLLAPSRRNSRPVAVLHFRLPGVYASRNVSTILGCAIANEKAMARPRQKKRAIVV